MSLKFVGLTTGKGHDEVFIATKNGFAIRFKEEDVRSMGRTASGVRAITLRKFWCSRSSKCCRTRR